MFHSLREFLSHSLQSVLLLSLLMTGHGLPPSLCWTTSLTLVLLAGSNLQPGSKILSPPWGGGAM